MSRKYESWERANKAYYLTYGLLPPSPYTQEDEDGDFCEVIVKTYLCRVFDSPTKANHPLKKIAKNRKSLIDWFNHKYPKKHD